MIFLFFTFTTCCNAANIINSFVYCMIVVVVAVVVLT
jgi:hypothetical protein